MSHPTARVPFALLVVLRRWAGRLRGSVAASNDALELRAMSDHELKDLGIGRSEVPEWSRRPVPAARPGTSEMERASARVPMPCVRMRIRATMA